jgi:hypothetical protein
VKFEVYSEGTLADKFSLDGAYLFGADGIPFRGMTKVSFEKGIITCQKKNSDAGGLAIMWPIKGFGKILLQTTRLPEKDGSYNLNVELARAKLMEIALKREDWSFLDESSEKIKTIKDLFVDALENVDNGPIASLIADECLKKAMVVAELLAAKNAEVFLKAKIKAGGFARHCLGCQLDPSLVDDSSYMSKITESFGFISIPIRWADVEPTEDDFKFEEMDKCFKAVVGKKIAVSIGPVLSFDKKSLPQWLVVGKGGFPQIRDRAYKFVNEVVGRYSPKVHAWKVLGGMNANNYFGFNFEQVLEISRAAVMAARAVDTRSLKIIDVIYPWGEYYACTADTIPPLVYLDMIMQSGINPDAVGLQIRFGANQYGMHLRDLMQVSAMLDRFAPLTKPLHITAVEIPGGIAVDEKGNHINGSGIWRDSWSDEIQGKWIEQFYKIVLGKSFISTVTYASFADKDGYELANSGLLTDKLKSKNGFEVLKKLQKLIVSAK